MKENGTRFALFLVVLSILLCSTHGRQLALLNRMQSSALQRRTGEAIDIINGDVMEGCVQAKFANYGVLSGIAAISGQVACQSEGTKAADATGAQQRKKVQASISAEITVAAALSSWLSINIQGKVELVGEVGVGLLNSATQSNLQGGNRAVVAGLTLIKAMIKSYLAEKGVKASKFQRLIDQASNANNAIAKKMVEDSFFGTIYGGVIDLLNYGNSEDMKHVNKAYLTHAFFDMVTEFLDMSLRSAMRFKQDPPLVRGFRDVALKEYTKRFKQNFLGTSRVGLPAMCRDLHKDTSLTPMDVPRFRHGPLMENKKTREQMYLAKLEASKLLCEFIKATDKARGAEVIDDELTAALGGDAPTARMFISLFGDLMLPSFRELLPDSNGGKSAGAETEEGQKTREKTFAYFKKALSGMVDVPGAFLQSSTSLRNYVLKEVERRELASVLDKVTWEATKALPSRILFGHELRPSTSLHSEITVDGGSQSYEMHVHVGLAHKITVRADPTTTVDAVLHAIARELNLHYHGEQHALRLLLTDREREGAMVYDWPHVVAKDATMAMAVTKNHDLNGGMLLKVKHPLFDTSTCPLAWPFFNMLGSGPVKLKESLEKIEKTSAKPELQTRLTEVKLAGSIGLRLGEDADKLCENGMTFEAKYGKEISYTLGKGWGQPVTSTSVAFDLGPVFGRFSYTTQRHRPPVVSMTVHLQLEVERATYNKVKEQMKLVQNDAFWRVFHAAVKGIANAITADSPMSLRQKLKTVGTELTSLRGMGGDVGVSLVNVIASKLDTAALNGLVDAAVVAAPFSIEKEYLIILGVQGTRKGNEPWKLAGFFGGSVGLDAEIMGGTAALHGGVGFVTQLAMPSAPPAKLTAKDPAFEAFQQVITDIAKAD